jgi:hypothetical protein
MRVASKFAEPRVITHERCLNFVRLPGCDCLAADGCLNIGYVTGSVPILFLTKKKRVPKYSLNHHREELL